jgi:hypothetical protein
MGCSVSKPMHTNEKNSSNLLLHTNAIMRIFSSKDIQHGQNKPGIPLFPIPLLAKQKDSSSRGDTHK